MSKKKKYDVLSRREIEKLSDAELIDVIIKTKNRAEVGIQGIEEGIFWDDKVIITGKQAEMELGLPALLWEFFSRQVEIEEY